MKKYTIMMLLLTSSLMSPSKKAIASQLEERVVFDAAIKCETPESLALMKLIENSFKAVTDMNGTEADYTRYHSEDYIQHVDGKTLNYDGFVAHVEELKKSLKAVKVVFHDMIINGNKVVTRHTAYAVKKDNREIEVQVIAIFEIKNGKIIRCDELTHLVKGEKEDRDIGSRK